MKRFLILFLCCLLILPIPVEASPESINSKEFSDKVLQIIQDNPEIILKAVESYQQKQRKQQREEKITFLKDLKNPQKAIGDSPIQGAVNAKIILIEFSDFQCPYCAKADETLKQFISKHQNQVALVYKHYPLDQIHSEAIPAAIASWAAYQQNQFWQFHDFLFMHQDQLGESIYIKGAKDLGLNLAKFNQDRKNKNAITAIQKDMELAEKLDISGTPFFVMNEETFSGAVQESFLEDKLAAM